MDQSTVIPLREACTEEAKRYTEGAYKALAGCAKELFQARKIGVVVLIPDSVRQSMIAAHGDDASAMFALVDGRVLL